MPSYPELIRHYRCKAITHSSATSRPSINLDGEAAPYDQDVTDLARSRHADSASSRSEETPAATESIE